jgi:hypothetical protein
VKGREYLDDATKEESGATRASPPSQPRPAQGFLPDSTSSHQHHLQPWNRRHKAHEFQIQRGGKRLRAVERILQIWRPATGAAPRHDRRPPEPRRPRGRDTGPHPRPPLAVEAGGASPSKAAALQSRAPTEGAAGPALPRHPPSQRAQIPTAPFTGVAGLARQRLWERRRRERGGEGGGGAL